MMLKSFLVIVLICYTSNGFPNDIKKCNIDDNNCMIEQANEIILKYSQGIEELGLPSIDPWLIDKIDVVQESREVLQLNLKLRNVEFSGLSKAKVYEVSGFKKDPERNRLVIRFMTPMASLIGAYDMKGQLLIFPVTGRGNITLTLPNLDIQLKFLTTKFVKDGKTFMKIDKAKLNYSYSRLSVYFSDLFNGDKEAGDKLNNFWNENWRLFDNFRKAIQTASAKSYKDIINSVFEKIPYEELFLI